VEHYIVPAGAICNVFCLFVNAIATIQKKNIVPNKFIYDPYEANAFHPANASG
jgi:hypothetical protein